MMRLLSGGGSGAVAAAAVMTSSKGGSHGALPEASSQGGGGAHRGRQPLACDWLKEARGWLFRVRKGTHKGVIHWTAVLMVGTPPKTFSSLRL